MYYWFRVGAFSHVCFDKYFRRQKCRHKAQRYVCIQRHRLTVCPEAIFFRAQNHIFPAQKRYLFLFWCARSRGGLHIKKRELTRKIWPKALPHYVLIFMCRHREMYYYFVHLRSFCYIMPLFLLLISPSALTLSDLYFRNTSPGQKQYSNTSPHRFVLLPCWAIQAQQLHGNR